METSLALSADEMRALGYRVVDMIVEHMETLPSKTVTHSGDREAIERRLEALPPETGADAEAVLDLLQREVLANMMHPDHPRYFAFVPGPGNFVSSMADALASGFNVCASAMMDGAGPAQIELITIGWLRQACGLPDTAGGLFVSGGSVANMLSLAVAREVKLGDQTAGAVVYCSDQTHSSVDRGLRVLGFGAGQVRVIPSDSDFRLDVAKLRRAIRRDRAAGLTPFCIVATAGTTNTGAIDPLHLLADLAEEEGLWLHVDGALGAAAVLDPRGKRLLSGIERADSLILDPHKWLFQPFEMGCMLVRETSWLEKVFRIAPEYLSDTQTQGDEVNFWERGIQHSRRFRALKLWLSVNIFGWSAFRQAVQRGFELAELAEALVREHEDWQIVTPAQLSILTFRYASPRFSQEQLDDINRALVEDLIADGSAMISSTVVRERTVLRMCTINPRTTDADMHDTIARLAALADRRVRGGQHTGQ